MEPPWSVRVQDRAPLSIIAVIRGHGWLIPDDRWPTRIGPGDLAVIRGPDPYTLADDPATEAQAVIHPGQRCTTVGGSDLAQAMDLGVRTWGNSPQGSTVMVVGTYEHRSDVSEGVLDALPPVLVLERGEWDSPLVPMLAEEAVRDEPGQAAVLDRLLDLLVVAALRTWFARAGADAPAWYRALDDPVVGRALRMLQHNPAHPWTVADLAAEVGVSRASLARRFTELVGEPPMTFLTSWRLALAADLLRQPDITLGAVAHEVGYASPYALSAAFKRVRGISPRAHRHASSVQT